MTVSKEDIKIYWETRLPQTWYSEKKQDTKEYYDEVEFVRYNIIYDYLPKIAEFQNYKGKKVLEIGVGIGTDLKQYIKHGAIGYGIDLAENAIKITQNHLSKYNLTAELKVMDAENLQFEDSTFDFVCSFGVLHHTPDTQKAIDEIYRILKPNGKTIVLLYAKGWQHYCIRIGYYGILKRELFRKSLQELTNEKSEAHGGSPLTKVYSRREIKNMFTKFKNVELSRHFMGHFALATFPKWLLKLCKNTKVDRFIGTNWIIKATK